jgi:hypothetical protein
VHVAPCVNSGAAGGCEGVQVGGGCGEGSGRARDRGKEGGFTGKAGDAKAPESELELYAGGNGIQSCRLKVRLAEHVERGAAKVIDVLLEVRAGSGRWDCAGEVLESELQRVGQDYPFVLTGQRMGQVG